MTDGVRSLLIVHHDTQMAKDLAGLVVKEHDVYIYLAGLGARAGEFLQNIGIDLVIASQELPDMTGMELFADLSRSHPAVARVLLLSGEEGVDAEEAVRRGLIDYYMVEPMDGSAFMGFLKDISRTDSDSTAPLRSPEEQEKLIQAAEAGPAIPLLHGMDMEAGGGPTGDDKADAAPLEHERAGEGFSSDLTMMGGMERIGPLQETQHGLIGENEQLRSLIEGLRCDNAALMIAQQRKNRVSEQNASLSRDKELLEQQVATMGSEIQRLQTELRPAREQLGELRSRSDSDPKPMTPIYLRYRHDPMEIYEKAAELNRQLCQARQSNSMLTLNLSTRERELSSAKEELDRLGRSLEDGRRRFQKELREYQKSCAFLKEAVESCQSRCGSLERENARLLKKLSWVQTEWNQFLESHKRTGNVSIE